MFYAKPGFSERFGYVTLRYDDLKEETFSINHPVTNMDVNQGRFFTTPQDTSAALESVTLEPPTTATGEVTVQVCRKPSFEAL